MAEPLVSIVMPNYNEAPFLRVALDSILKQTWKNFECIIVDDGSSDGSREIIQEYAQKDPRIIFLANEKNLLICKTLNRGLGVARGKYVARMDSDDVCMPNRLETQVRFLELPENSRVGVVGSSVKVINEHGEQVGEKKFPLGDTDIRNMIWYQTPIQHSSAMIRKQAIEECGNYDNDYVYAEDLELWVKIGQKYELRNLPETLVQYRVHGTNDIFKHQKRMIKNALRVRKKAVKDLGYRMPLKARIAYVATKVAYFLPEKLVFKLFMKFRGGVR